MSDAMERAVPVESPTRQQSGPRARGGLGATAVRRRLFATRRRLEKARSALADRLFGWHVLAAVGRRDHVLCLGDSHVAVMDDVRVPGVWFRAKALRGATASGVMNPQSKTSSLQVFDAHLARTRRWQQVLLQLGEVDCGFVIWLRAQRQRLSVEEQLELTVESYATFIEKVMRLGVRRVIVLSVPLPTIGDDPDEWGEIANMRKTVKATQHERTRLTLRFNEAVRERCDALGVLFVDVTSGHYDPETGLVDRRYVRDSHQDHHLADEPFAELIASELAARWR
jgi:hypothetical protein